MTGSYERSYVVMGNIAYPVNSSQMPYGSVAEKILDKGVHFTVDMGEVHMTPSREQLEYNDETIATIKRRCEEIASEVGIQVTKQLDECESQWDASLLAKRWRTKLTNLNLDFSSSKWDIVKSIELEATWRFKYSGVGTGTKVKRNTLEYKNSCPVSPYSKIVIQDEERGFDKACRLLASTDSDLFVYLVKGITKAEALTAVGATEPDNVVFLSSELPKPAPAARGSRVRKTTRTVKGYCPKGNSSTRSNVYESRYWDTECEIDVSEDQVYINLDRYDMDFNVHSARNECVSLGLDVPDIIGLNNQTSKLSNKSNFIHFRDWIKAELAELDGDNLQERASNMYALGIMGLGKRLCTIAGGGEFIDPNSPAKLLADYTKDLKNVKTDNFVSSFVSLASLAGYNFEYKKDSIKVEELEDAVRERYPILISFLDEIGDWQLSSHSSMLVDTINMLDLATLHSGE
jgi:hypothetical protein